MEMAIALGERGRGQTAPNPSVGCLIVKDEEIVGRGWTQPGGRPHAEAVALGEAGARARGATAFVTLEPCAVPGRGPACAEALVGSRHRPGRGGCSSDPFHRVNGDGFEKLRAAGIVVETGLCAERGRALDGRLPDPAAARPALCHAEARHVARRPDRASVGRKPLDHRRGSPRPCPPASGRGPTWSWSAAALTKPTCRGSMSGWKG